MTTARSDDRKREKGDTVPALLRRVGHGLARIEREQICCGNVTRHQFLTLRVLDEAGGLSTSDLAKRLGIDLSTASRNLDVLERARCIRRRASPHDARAVHNEVAPRGRACIEALCCDEQSAFAAVFDRLAPTDRPAVLRALSLLAEALEGPAEACCADARAPGSSRRPTRRKHAAPGRARQSGTTREITR